jgi:hypothetical protein
MGSDPKPEREDDGQNQHIETCADLTAFFYETVTRALAERRIDAPCHTERYLVMLLSELGKDELSSSCTFVELELDARSGNREMRLSKLRALGDRALSYSGLFDLHRERYGLARDYVRGVGSRAYRIAGELASRSRDRVERLRADVFGDLGRRFDAYADVLEDVRESTALGTPDDVLSLFERCAKSHSPTLARRLSEHGVLTLSFDPVES